MHVRIQYDGPPDQFGWLLPVPNDPELEVELSTEALFDGLDAIYAPRFIVQRIFDDSCPPMDFAVAADGSVERSEDDSVGGVNVISREAVGPYDRVILEATDVSELRAWLDENQYFIPPSIDAKLSPYVERGLHFVAIKLLASAGTDDIAPLRLTFAGNKPSIPIVPTSVAANADMGVLVHLLYDDRAVPLNYLHVEINEAALDLSNGGQNYPDVVSQAVDEAGGKAFTTDFAGELDGQLEGRIQPFDESTINRLETVQALIESGLAADADVQRVANSIIDFPEGTNASDFWANPFAYESLLEQALNVDELWQKLEQEVNPARRSLVTLMENHRYLTRLYSTLSPEEMTLDPEFTFNPDMNEPVSNVRTIEVQISCDVDDGSEDDAVLMNAAGEEVAADLSGESATRRENGVTVSGQMRPAAAIIQRTSERGAPEIVGGMGTMDETMMPDSNGTNNEPTSGGIAPASDEGCEGGCSQQSSPMMPIAAVILLSVVGIRRRR